MTQPQRAFDLIVFGATSFVGRLVCEYLFAAYGVNGSLRWAAAGRSQERLERVRAELGEGAAALPLVTADAADEEALLALCRQTRLVIATVGPYSVHGEPLVSACARSGTDYCDLAGETPWIRTMIRRYESTAATSGARIVHACGFDAVPSDLGVHTLQREAQRRFGEPLDRVRFRVRAARGGFSGGTVASISHVLAQARGDPGLRRILADPYSLCPDDHGFTARQPVVSGASFDARFDAWVAPFLMGPINTPVVHRSNALRGGAYGNGFRYDEAVLTGRGMGGRLRALVLGTGLKMLTTGLMLRSTRWLLRRLVLPAPGQGPDRSQRENGFFDLRLAGESVSGARLGLRVTGDRDPGYGATARMVAEAAVCLLHEAADEAPAGFPTPAVAMGDALVERLCERAEVRFQVTD